MKSSRLCRMLLSLCVLSLSIGALRAQVLPPLPEGESGTAAKCPEDVGIETDPAVVFADGSNKFLVSYECTVYSQAPSPGNLTVYVYHPEQRSDYGDIFYPNGLISPNTSRTGNIGEHFVARPDALPDLDRWHCYEFMVQANTVGQRDGRIACWLDGKLIADFPNMRFRDIETLKIDYLTIGGYINPNKMRTNRIWLDDVVSALGPSEC